MSGVRGEERRDFVTLSLPSSVEDDNIQPLPRPRTRRSIWRWWKQLSRFQRSVFYMSLLAVCLTIIYMFPVAHLKNAALMAVNSVRNLDGESNKLLDMNSHKTDGWNEKSAMYTAKVIMASKSNFHVNHAALATAEKGVKKEENEKVIKLYPVHGKRDKRKDIEQQRKEETNQIVPPPDGKSKLKFNGPTNERQEAVVAAFRHAWDSYKTYAWGHDHLRPLTKTYHNWFGLGLTLIDALDTMYIMGLQSEFEEAKKWVETSLDFNINKDVNLFETTIRVLGGLLSIYHLSGYEIFLERAKDIGSRLLPCFNTASGVPYSDVNLRTLNAHSPKWNPDSSTSEVTTIQLEFKDLSRASGDSKFEEAVNKVSKHIHSLPKKDGLVPIFVNANTGNFRSYSTITIGARGDSYYEYLLKQWIQTGKKEDYLRDDYNQSISGVMRLLTRRTKPNNLLFVGELLAGGRDFKPKMDELVCFLPGTLALGVHNGMPVEHMKFAEELLYTCYQTFVRHPTSLAAEIAYFNTEEGSTSDFYIKSNDAHYLLRPETLESLWYLYHLTGNKTYQDWGWQIFQGIEKYTKVRGGYTSIGNVKSAIDTRPRDMMESFFLGETLKYLYLLFSDDQSAINVDNFVINSEGHPLPILHT